VDWTYDLGPDAFVHVVTLENGRVTAVERRGYGYRRAAFPPPAPPRARCDPAYVREGDVKLDVLSRCGEPAVVDDWEESRSAFVSDGHGRRAVGEVTTVRVEQWTCDLGRNRLGRVVAVTSGSYGYAE
jgi:hypothetical protein